MNNINIIIIPADNRPVSYSLPDQIASLNNKINVFLPPRYTIGGLNKPADIDAILDWLKITLADNTINYMICALDTIAYGGLINSRNYTDQEETILSRLEAFKQICKNSNAKLYTFSSIMRISDSNVNEEEKNYWYKYGKLIFKYSCLKHKTELEPQNSEIKQDLENTIKQIPPEVLKDYTKTRKLNFSVNQKYLSWLKEKELDYLIFGKDDTAPLGLNVQESMFLNKKIKENNLSDKAVLHTGADEIISILLMKAVKKDLGMNISAYPLYSTKNGEHIIPRYEDRSLFKSIENYFKLLEINIAKSKEDADILLLLHTPQREQNDLALSIFCEEENPEAVDFCINTTKNTNKPVILADVLAANGADNLLITKLLKEKNDNLYGYAGWNTASNTIGTAISMGISKYIAEKSSSLQPKNFQKLMLTRLADDWAYQTITRKIIREKNSFADETQLKHEIMPLLHKIALKLNVNTDTIKLKFPWNRTFEVEIIFEEN